MMRNTIAWRTKVIPLYIAFVQRWNFHRTMSTHLVPRSIARVRPPVWRDKWNLRSRFNRCPKVSRATFRTARCPTLANTALSISPKSVAPMRAAPSERWMNKTSKEDASPLTSKNQRTTHHPNGRPCRNIQVQQIDDLLEYKGYLNVQQLFVWQEFSSVLLRMGTHTHLSSHQQPNT